MYLGSLSIRSKVSFLSLALAIGIAAFGCGGGSSGGGSPPPQQPNNPPPVDVDPPDDDPQSTGRFILRNGDSTEDGVVVGNIEDGALDDSGSVAAIISVDAGNRARAVVQSPPNGSFESIYDQSNAGSGVDLTTLERLRMAPTGEVAFKSGSGLDSDRLHLVAGGVEHTVAGEAPGVEAPDFRVLGNFGVVSGGALAFVGGGATCTPDDSGETVVDVCTLGLFVSDRNGVVTRLEQPDFELEERKTDDARVTSNGTGDVYFSIPGRRSSPTLLRYANGEIEVLLRASTEIPDLGTVRRVDVIGVDNQGDALVTVGIRFGDETSPVLDILGVLTDDGFTRISGEGDVEGDKSIGNIRGLGFSNAGKALFEVTLEGNGEEKVCLRLADAQSSTNIACEGEQLTGTQKVVLSISGVRMNNPGDVLFVSELGRISSGTTFVDEIRASVRRANGNLVTIASSADLDRLGTISDLTTVGFNNAGAALLIAERGRSSNRGLLIGPSS